MSTALADFHHQGFVPEGCPVIQKKPRRGRSFTPEFKAEIVGLCQREDRSVGPVAKDFGLTGTAVREWVKQAERDTGTRQDGEPDQRRAAGTGRAAAREPQAPRGQVRS